MKKLQIKEISFLALESKGSETNIGGKPGILIPDFAEPPVAALNTDTDTDIESGGPSYGEPRGKIYGAGILVHVGANNVVGRWDTPVEPRGIISTLIHLLPFGHSFSVYHDRINGYLLGRGVPDL